MADIKDDNLPNGAEISENGNNGTQLQGYAPVSNNDNGPDKKGMKKGVKIAIISVVSLLVTAGAVFAVLYATKKEYVQNWWAMLTRSDTEYYQWVANRSLDRNVEQMKNIELPALPDTLSSDFRVSASVSKEFGELVGLQNFEGFNEAGLELKASKLDNSEYNLALSPFYNGVNILQLALNMNTDSGELYVGIPDYTLDSIALSEYFGTPLKELVGRVVLADGTDPFEQLGISKNESVASLLKSLFAEYSSAYNKINPEELSELYGQLMVLCRDSVDEAVLTKNVQPNVRGITAECNTLTARIKKAAILKAIEGYLDILEQNSYADTNEEMKGQVSSLFLNLKQRLEQLFEEEAISAELVLYIDKKGDVLGGELKVTYNEIKVKITVLSEKTDEYTTKTGIELEVNTIRALNIIAEYKKTETGSVLSVNAKPGAMVTGFIGKKDICLLMDCRNNRSADGGSDSEIDIRIKESESADSNLAAVKLNYQAVAKSSDSFVKTSGDRVHTTEDIVSTEYIDVTRAANFAIDRIDTINNEGFNNFVANMLGKTPLGVIDPKVLLVNLRDTGVTDMLTNQIKAFLAPGETLEPVQETEQPEDSEESSQELPDTSEEEGSDIEQAAVEPEEVTPEPEVFVPYDYSTSKAFLADYVEELTYSGITYDPKIYITVDEDPTVARNSFLELCGRDSYYAAPEGYSIQMGDEFYFSACAVVAGFVVDGYSYDNCYALMGRYDYGDGIDDKIVGMRVGESKDLVLTLDSRFGAFEGYTGTFRITCTAIKKYVEPEWSEAYIVGCLGYESLEACDLSIGNTGEPSLVFMGEYKDRATLRSEIRAAVFDSLKLKEFDSLAYTRYRIVYDREQLMSGGMTYYEYFENNVLPGVPEGNDIALYRDLYFRDMVKEQMVEDAVMAYIAAKEGITLTADNMESLVTSYAEPLGMSLEEVFAQYGEESVNNAIINNLAEEYIYTSAVKAE